MVMEQKREPPQQVERRGRAGRRGYGARRRSLGTLRTREGDEEERARERSLPPPHLGSEEPSHARVHVGTKTADPGTIYRPRLSRSLACRLVCTHLALYLPTYLPTCGGALLLLSHEAADERASERSPCDACRRGLPILRAGGARPRVSSNLDRGIG